MKNIDQSTEIIIAKNKGRYLKSCAPAALNIVHATHQPGVRICERDPATNAKATENPPIQAINRERVINE
jgi:hypothetical protein